MHARRIENQDQNKKLCPTIKTKIGYSEPASERYDGGAENAERTKGGDTPIAMAELPPRLD